MDSRLEKLADLLIGYSLDIKKGEHLQIMGDYAALPAMTAAYKAALKRGANITVHLGAAEFSELLYKYGSDEQLDFVAPHDYEEARTTDALLYFWASRNTRARSNIDPTRLRRYSQAHHPLNKIYDDREAQNLFRWCGTQYPTQADAQEANMSLSEYEDFVYGAGMLDDPDPVAHWKKVSESQERICSFLNTKSSFRYRAADTDLTFSAKGRNWVNCDGMVNFPDGEIFTGPVEDSVEGHIRFSFPGIYQGREIEDIRLTFEKGKVVKASATKGEDLLLKLLDTDAGSRFVGEIAIGTNPGIQKFTRNMLFDEKIGGTVHLALGRSIPESKGVNESAIHWDMLCDMRDGGEIWADGEMVYKSGKFII